MNKRIRELAEQSGFFPVPDETETDWEYRAENARYENFAALIVQECVTICNDNIVPTEQQGELTYNDGVMDCSIMIEKHFKKQQ